MDVRAERPYVRHAMNLLLLLSALLSALTGVGAVRGPQAARTVAERVEAVAAAATRVAAVTTRPVQGLATLVAAALPPTRARALVVYAIPAWTTRRRE